MKKYLKMLGNTVLAVGNFSSFFRNTGFLDSPVVLGGSIQEGRYTDSHVRRVFIKIDAIEASIWLQLANEGYHSN